MFAVDWSTGATIYLLCACLFLFSLWLWYDRRDRAYYEMKRRRSVYHCVKCGKMYDGPADQKVKECPSCGFANAPLRF
ncbi:MAG: hypothetical protein JJT75_08620 [Opitutales bacterium]|nr:hypothetical protein [Opitutales bacterium]MCH8539827.1 hypothetical protein [Opitutales bacterium]